MPKINIKEIDNTRAGELAYENFSAVVPGIIASDGDSDRFDENDVCELKTVKDFDEIVGHVPDEDKYAGAAKLATATIKSDLTARQFYQDFVGQLYTYVLVADGIPEGKGKLYFKVDTPASGETPATTTYYRATKVGETAEYIQGANYCVIRPGDEGHDRNDISTEGHIIARRLLELGYTVLYKNITGKNPAEASCWDCFKDKANYDFRYIIPGIYDADVYAQVLNVVKCVNIKTANLLKSNNVNGRGDAIALLDIIEDDLFEEDGKHTQSEIIAAVKEQVAGWSAMLQEPAGKYAAIFMPRVIYEDGSEMPASFHYLACGAKAFEKYNEWYAVAGYVRGVSNLKVVGSTLKLGDIAVNALQPRYWEQSDDLGVAINPVTCERGKYYIWGNRTAHALTEDGLVASHFLNIRQLCCTLKKEIYVACRGLTFDPNSDILWINFCNKVRPVLEKMKGDQGIKDYKFIKVRSDVKALMKAKIRIVPIEAVEDFDIGVYLEDSISGIKAEAEEE